MKRAPRSTPNPVTRRTAGDFTDPTRDPVVMTFWNAVDAVLRRRANVVAGQHADDVRQRVAVQFFTAPYAVMAAYTPEAFANVALTSRAADHRRTERIQRGEGARLRHDPVTGLARPAREVCGLEGLDPETDRIGDPVDADIEIRITDRAELRDALRLLDPKIALLLYLVAVEGWTVTDAAGHVRLSRAYANRRLSAAKALLADVITAA